jgi:glucose-1-phosphate cytidylyltransferase
MVSTGAQTMTGGRLQRLEPLLRSQGTFMLTYGDGVADVDIRAVIAFHRQHGRLATVTAVRPPARFGGLVIEDNQVIEFKEKPQTGESWINGGFFVFEPGIFDYLKGDATVLEEEPLENLSRDGQLMAFQHYGFWHCMDTLRDRNSLEKMWQTNQAAWKVW